MASSTQADQWHCCLAVNEDSGGVGVGRSEAKVSPVTQSCVTRRAETKLQRSFDRLRKRFKTCDYVFCVCVCGVVDPCLFPFNIARHSERLLASSFLHPRKLGSWKFFLVFFFWCSSLQLSSFSQDDQLHESRP